MKMTIRKKITLISISMIIAISTLILLTRHIHPTPDKPTYETLTLKPYDEKMAQHTRNQSTANADDSAPITSIPAAEAWVLGISNNQTHI